MANPEHLAKLKAGVEAWNLWKADPNVHEADLSEADLLGANLTRANLTRANLTRANLARANLFGATLTEADLSGADLHQADLHWADLSEADLSEADLRVADLSRAYLRGANLTGADVSRANLQAATFQAAKLTDADLTGATVGWTVFADIDLGSAKGLESVEHLGPSHITIDAIYRSGGKIPDVFLRGAGVPDNFIAYIGSLVGNAIEFYSCFISYSTKDQEFAERLHADLQAKGVRCWFAPHDIAGGKKIQEQIDEAIRLHDKLLLILSPASMASNWVKTEISMARKREKKEQKRVLFPVRLVDYEPDIRDWECFDADLGIDSAGVIREYFIPDFSRWKDHDSFQEAFQRLLRDLKAEADR